MNIIKQKMREYIDELAKINKQIEAENDPQIKSCKNQELPI